MTCDPHVETAQYRLPQLSDTSIDVLYVDDVLNRARRQLTALLDTMTQSHAVDTSDWNAIRQLESIESRVAEVWAAIDHLQSVAQRDDQKSNYQTVLEKITQWNTELAQNDKLHTWIKTISEHATSKKLDNTQQMLVDYLLRHFRLAGVDLSQDKKQRYQMVHVQLAKDSATFETNLIDSSREQAICVEDVQKLEGLSDRVLKAAAQAAKEQARPGWLLKMDGPTYQAVMSTAAHESLRQAFYTAWMTRASETTPFDNSQLMDKILMQRHELSHITQFANYAERSLAQDKVAKTPEEVMRFLRRLLKQAMPQAHHELKELQAFAKELGKNELLDWDLAFFSEKLRQLKFRLQQEQLRAYFPLPHVLNELLRLIHEQFELDSEAIQGEALWNPDVRVLAIKNTQGNVLGYLYLDLYARTNKRSGAWVYPYLQRRVDESNHVHLPIAFLVCNFSPPVLGEPALLTHYDVVTLFHEMGHALHHILTQVDYSTLSGMAGVAWDVVEFPSQLLEQFPFSPMILRRLGRHYQTGQQLTDATIQALHESKCFQAGLALVRQVEFSLFDFTLHLRFNPAKGTEQIQAILDEIREHTRLLPVPSFNRFQHSFTHIFSGGYAAGYYSYLWAEVWAADAFARFVEEGLGQGIVNPSTGRDFIDSVFARGGSVDMLTLFEKFRGRDPDPTIFLLQRGILSTQS